MAKDLRKEGSWIVKKLDNIILWISFLVIISAFNFGDYAYFKLNALFIGLISFILKRQNPKSFICYLIFCGAINNLVDELFFDNTKVGINEFFALICVPIIWYLRKNERI